MSSYINFSLHMVMINLNPTLWRTQQSNPRLACCLQGDLPYDHANDEEEDDERQQPGAQALLLPSHG